MLVFRKLTAQSHLAGTPADKKQAEEMKVFWESQGLTSWLTPYDVLLSYPDKDNPNRIELRDGSGKVQFTTQLVEKRLRPDESHTSVMPPFNAFSGKGTPEVSEWRGILSPACGRRPWSGEYIKRLPSVRPSVRSSRFCINLNISFTSLFHPNYWCYGF